MALRAAATAEKIISKLLDTNEDVDRVYRDFVMIFGHVNRLICCERTCHYGFYCIVVTKALLSTETLIPDPSPTPQDSNLGPVYLLIFDNYLTRALRRIPRCLEMQIKLQPSFRRRKSCHDSDDKPPSFPTNLAVGMKMSNKGGTRG